MCAFATVRHALRACSSFWKDENEHARRARSTEDGRRLDPRWSLPRTPIRGGDDSVMLERRRGYREASRSFSRERKATWPISSWIKA